MKVTDKIANPINLITPLIKKSFAESFEVNYSPVSSEDRFNEPLKSPFLFIFGNRIDPSAYMFNHDRSKEVPSFNFSGQLGDGEGLGDGSIIAVFPFFKDRAIKYAQLYEEFFKKEVEIIIASELDYDGKGKYCKFPFKIYSAATEENELTKISGLEQKLFLSKAKKYSDAIKSLTISKEGILEVNGCLNEEQKNREYSELANYLSSEERETLIQKLEGDLSYLGLAEKETPGILKKYFGGFNLPIESVSDLALFQRALLEAK